MLRKTAFKLKGGSSSLYISQFLKNTCLLTFHLRIISAFVWVSSFCPPDADLRAPPAAPREVDLDVRRESRQGGETREVRARLQPPLRDSEHDRQSTLGPDLLGLRRETPLGLLAPSRRHSREELRPVGEGGVLLARRPALVSEDLRRLQQNLPVLGLHDFPHRLLRVGALLLPLVSDAAGGGGLIFIILLLFFF